MREIKIEEEGVSVLIKDNENTKNHISFRLKEDGVVQPYYISATREAPTVVRLFIQFPYSETSKKITMVRGELITLISQIVTEVLDLISEFNVK